RSISITGKMKSSAGGRGCGLSCRNAGDRGWQRSGRAREVSAAIGASYVYVIGFFQSWLQTYLVKGRGFTAAALVFSTLPYIVGAWDNGIGGPAGDTPW